MVTSKQAAITYTGQERRHRIAHLPVFSHSYLHLRTIPAKEKRTNDSLPTRVDMGRDQTTILQVDEVRVMHEQMTRLQKLQQRSAPSPVIKRSQIQRLKE